MNVEQNETNENVIRRNPDVIDAQQVNQRDEVTRTTEVTTEKQSEPPVAALKKDKVAETDNSVLTFSILGALSLIFFTYYLFGDHRKLKDIPLNEESSIIKFNKKKKDYSVKANSFFHGMSLDHVSDYFKPMLTDKKQEPRCNSFELQDVIVPGQYNFYEQYPKCRFAEIQQKSPSGYVEVLTSVFRSRYCMMHMDEDFGPSANYLLSCDKASHGSKSGYMEKVLDFVKKRGFISQKCWSGFKLDEGKCVSESDMKKCDRIENVDFCFLNNTQNIKKEIFKNGPVISVMPPYQNFILFDKGIFNFDKSRKLEGSIFVKIVGWDKGDKNNEFWILESTWGKNWGDNGFAKVRMNVAGSMLDNMAIAVNPRKAEVKAEAK